MKVRQQTIVRWVAKLVSKPVSRSSERSVKVLDTEQLRQVAGGTGAANLPYKGW